MPYFINDTRHWTERAEHARKLAAEITDPVEKRRMFEVAAAYERMAQRATARRAEDNPGAEK